MTRRALGLVALLAVLLLAVAGVTGCGGSDDDETELTVSAAASLKAAFEAYGRDLDGVTVRYSFAGSDELAAQIEQGVKPDVFAAANTRLPDRLFANGLVEKPVVFAQNRLVIGVPAGSEVDSIDDLEEPGTTIAIGSPSVPIGSYTRDVLGRLPAAQREAILANVRTEEPDVAGIIGKLTQGAVDAGFVYVTDVTATKGKLEAIDLPARLQPEAAYGAAVVEGAAHPDAAKRFIDGLLSGDGARALRDAGFEPPLSGGA
jgi:molybdate transport system substrate-binding protein